SGSASGLSTVGPALCEGHGGVADPGGSGAGAVQVKPAVKKPVPDKGTAPASKELDKSSPQLMR
ncbi:MAG: hypothetical protein R3360_03665, partial [Alphaproteobacteria bacterium]|nr:hypothetical protein [Alphaproteobacteria bacterium]